MHYQETIKNDQNIKINSGIKCSKTKIDKKSAVGKNNSKYQAVDYKFIIEKYFEINDNNSISNLYNQFHKTLKKKYILNLSKKINIKFSGTLIITND